jgi:hypothetical protein
VTHSAMIGALLEDYTGDPSALQFRKKRKERASLHALPNSRPETDGK